jgi:hypothetical protein
MCFLTAPAKYVCFSQETSDLPYPFDFEVYKRGCADRTPLQTSKIQNTILFKAKDHQHTASC